LSRPRSATGRGASAGGRVAPGRPGVFVQKPKSDVFVAMLGVSLVAMITGCILLVMILNRYEFKTKASSLARPASSTSVALLEKSANPVTVHL
jgi:hypothetical protein